MKPFTKEEAKSFRTDFMKAMAELENKYDGKISTGNITFGARDLRTRVTFTRTVDPVDAENRAKKEWDLYQFRYGYENSWFGRTFSVDGMTFKVTGVHGNRPKYPIEITCIETGLVHKATVAYLNFYMKGK